MDNILIFDHATFDTYFSKVLSEIKSRISAVSFETAAFSPQLAYLKHLDLFGLKELTYLPDVKPGNFEFSFQQKRITISDQFREGWMRMVRHANATGKYDILQDSLENFILHELFHRDQQLTSEQHADYRSAPNVGRIIDYHADASAILASILLHSESDGTFEYAQWRHLYLRFIRSIIFHISAFVQMDRAGESGVRSISLSNSDWRLNVFNRHLCWHYQYHRLGAFRLSAHVDQVQLLIEPGMSLRFMHDIDWNGNRPPINRTWPENEKRAIISARMRALESTDTQLLHKGETDYGLAARANLDRDHLILAAPNFWGIFKIYRFSPSATSSLAYEQLFEGVIGCDPEKTKPFFTAAFDDPDWRQLTGHSWLPPRGPNSPRGGPKPDDPGSIRLDDSAPRLYKLAALHAQDFGDRRYIPARAELPSSAAEMHAEV